MIRSIEILNIGISGVDEKRWKKKGRAINRIHLPLKGSCVYKSANRNFPLREGGFYLITNSYTNDLVPLPNTPYYHFFIDFTSAPMLRGKGVTQISVDDSAVKHLLLAALALVEDFMKQNGETERIPKDKTKLFKDVKALVMLTVERLVAQHKLVSITDEKLDSALAFIESNYARKLRNEDIAKAVGTDARSLAGMFAKYVDMSPYQYLIQCRIEHSLEELKQGKSISEIARLCGFNSENSFRITFKKVMGHSPRTIKKRMDGETK